MFNNAKDKISATWFPGKTQARDRWGEPIGADIRAREFQGAGNAPTAAAARLRWSLGHA